MLRLSLAQRALRASPAVRLRHLHGKVQTLTPPPSSFAARAAAASDMTPPATPLYARAPEPPAEENLLEGVPLDDKGLPSLDWINRQAKTNMVGKAIEGVEEYDEGALRDFYKQVVLSGAQPVVEELPMISGPEQPLSAEKRTALIEDLAKRLHPEGDHPTALLPSAPTDAPRHVVLTAALIQVAPKEDTPLNLPTGLVSRSQWQALLDAFLDKQDPAGAEILLTTMRRHGSVPTSHQLDKVLEVYAHRGQTTEVARLLSDFEAAGLTVTDHHRDILISSYLHGTKPNPRAAIEILTASENMGRPFPQSSYNVILTHLVEPTLRTQTDSHSRALAWDLFANMRLSAHSTPTRELYTTMIRACGQSTDPQPERARDLWIELTTGSGRVKPNRQEYDSIIRALGSTKDDYLEAFDLLRQMLALHQEATFVPFEKVDMTERMSPWVPTVETFTALLEGTKRAADLDRARWVLSEVVDLARAAAFSGQNLKGPDADLMTNVFMTYAAWTPPISRSSVTVQKEAGAEEDAAPESDEGPTEVVESDHDSSNDMPRTAAEALREADMLFQRIITDANAEARGPAAAVHHPFAGVKLTPRLVNSYLSVHLAHAPTYADARRVHEKVWEGLAKLNNGPRPNGWTFLDIMGRCTRGSISLVDRPVASVWGAATWDAYRKWADKALKEMDDDLRQRRHRFVIGLSERQIERMWGYGIRHAALNGDIDLALKRLGEFVQLYPPSDLLKTYQPAPRQEGFKITMMDPTTVAEPNVPPHLLFRDLNMVHQACLRDENMRGVHMIKFATTAYLKALQRRRNWRLNNAGVARVLQKKKKGVFVKSGVLENNRVAAPEEDEDE